MSQLALVLDRVAALPPRDGVLLIGIGGRGAAGKSTLARSIAARLPDTQIVATDSFWNGSLFDLDRLRATVVDAVLAGSPATYDEWLWAEQRSGPAREVRPDGLIIIEGVCALHQMFRDDLDVRVWVEAPYDVRLARGVARDGETSRAKWVDVWMPGEDAYVERDDPVSCADLVVDGTCPFD